MLPETLLPVTVEPFSDRYSVSNHGRVWSHKKNGFLKLCRNASEHLFVHLHCDGENKTQTVHRLVALAFIGQPGDPELIVCHKDDNKMDNSVGNLYWGTRSDNQLDRVKNGIHTEAIKTHCRRNHRLEAPNLEPFNLTQGKRTCLACNKAMSHARYMKKRGTTINEDQIKIRADLEFNRLKEKGE